MKRHPEESVLRESHSLQPLAAFVGELEVTLHEEIPLTQAIGITAAWHADRLLLTAPLAPNVNHKDTAFAGSLTSVATLAGWGLLWLLLRSEELSGKIVIQDCTVRYLRPVTADFTAGCALPAPASRDRFLATFRKHGRARLELRAAVHQDGQLALELVGRYVVHR